MYIFSVCLWVNYVAVALGGGRRRRREEGGGGWT